MRRTARSTLFPYTTLFRSDLGPQAIPLPPARPAPGGRGAPPGATDHGGTGRFGGGAGGSRSEEHTSELQSLRQLVCRRLLEKKKTASAESWLQAGQQPPAR